MFFLIFKSVCFTPKTLTQQPIEMCLRRPRFLPGPCLLLGFSLGGVAGLRTENVGCPAKFEFQINNNYFFLG